MASVSSQAPKRKIMTTVLVDDAGSAKRSRSDVVNIASTSDAQDSFQQGFTATPVPIPPPTLQNTINVRLDEILASNGRIASVQAQNYIGQNNHRSCRIRTLTKDNERVWTSTILTQVNHLAANENWVVLVSQIGEFFCYSTMSGSFLLSLRLDYPILKIMLNKEFCAVQNTNDQIIVWNFEQNKRVATYKMTPLLLRSSEKVSTYLLSNTGLPVVFMKNGDLWYYSNRQSTWRQIQTGIDMLTSFMTHLEFIQKVVTNGLISKIIINKKQLKPAGLPSALVAENAEEEQMEFLLGALDEMNYTEEYLLLASMYVQRLVSRGKTRRLYTYMKLLETPHADSVIDLTIVSNEIEEVLSRFPLIQKEVIELPSKMDNEVFDEDDLGFL